MSDLFVQPGAANPATEAERAAPDPLSLTVHAMPSPAQALAQDARRTRAGRWQMLLLALVCAAPVAASYFSYFVIRPQAHTNFGALIDPQRPLPALTATDLDGKPVPLTGLKGQWLLVSVAGGACDALCESNLYLQRQVREGLGKEKDRVDWVWLINDNALPPAALTPALQQATVLRVEPGALKAWLEPAQGQQLADHLYVVDPMGNWMMRFPAAMDTSGAAKAKRDLERLLRASSSWDEPGRPAKP